VTKLAEFPSRDDGRGTDAVPTCVVRGPDGAYYVGELTGVPFAVGAANIYRVVPGQASEVVHPGFKTIIDMDFGPDGSLYVLQHATGAFFSGPGILIRVSPDGTRTTIIKETDGLIRPTSVLVDDDGTIYVTNKGLSVGAGEVLRIDPSAPPSSTSMRAAPSATAALSLRDMGSGDHLVSSIDIGFVHAFTGLDVAVERLFLTDPIVPPNPIRVAPVFALNYGDDADAEVSNGLDVAVSLFAPVDPCMIVSPIFSGLAEMPPSVNA
jgi:hypothetical protein